MAKITRSEIKNIKNISEFSADLNGCTAYIIAGNTKGKTTFIRFLLERLMGNKYKPEVLNDKTKQGYASIKMDDGNEFIYTLESDGKEKLTFVSNSLEFKVTKEIVNKYIPNSYFDIDAFVNATPKEKVNILTKTLGIDVSEEKQKLKQLISIREERFRAKNQAKSLYQEFQIYSKPIDENQIKQVEYERKKIIEEYENKVKSINEKNKETEKKIQELTAERERNINEYKSRKEHIEKDVRVLEDCLSKTLFLRDVEVKEETSKCLSKNIELLKEKYNNILKEEENRINYNNFINKLPKKEDVPPPPDLSEIDNTLRKADLYREKYKQFLSYKEQYEKAESSYNEIDAQIKEIEGVIKSKMESVKLPDGITINEEGVFYNGMPVDKEHLSLSELYIVSLLLSSVNLKELRTLYFDCSPLDKVSLQKVLDWAEKNDLQLLIEKPDFEAGELRFELIEQK